MNLSRIDEPMQYALHTTAPAISLAVYHDDVLIVHDAWGWIDPDTQQHPVTTQTLFDLASLTKLFTTTAFLVLASQQNIVLSTPIGEFLPEFIANGLRPIDGGQDPHTGIRQPIAEHLAGKTVDPRTVSLWHLLTHSSGLPPWRDVYSIAPPPVENDLFSPAMRWQMGLAQLFSYPFVDCVGASVRYSDIGLMLLGEIVARLNNTTLEEAIQQHVIQPLGVTDVLFNPLNHHQYSQNTIAPTEFDSRWRGRRVWGEVHDENACGVGGVAGHAGLFASASSVARFGLAWLNHDSFAINPDLWEQAVHEQVNFEGERRGLGWMLRSIENSSAGHHMSPRSFGHTGFTGTSLWIDPERQLVVALLTNRVYWGRDGAAIHNLRRLVHDTIVEHLP